MDKSFARAFLLFGTMCAAASGAGYISFTPGPGFTTRVNTPQGNYIVDMEPDGGAAWVGTEEEYVNRKAQGILHMQGYKEMHVEGAARNEHHMINGRLPIVTLGSAKLAQVYGSINFDKHPAFNPAFHAPRQRHGYEYAFVGWVPSAISGVRATLRVTSSAEIFEPFNCDSETCRYQIPQEKLGVPLIVIFTAPHSKPAALAISSLAHSQFQAERAFHRPGDPYDAKLLESLHEIDPAVPPYL